MEGLRAAVLLTPSDHGKGCGGEAGLWRRSRSEEHASRGFTLETCLGVFPRYRSSFTAPLTFSPGRLTAHELPHSVLNHILLGQLSSCLPNSGNLSPQVTRTWVGGSMSAGDHTKAPCSPFPASDLALRPLSGNGSVYWTKITEHEEHCVNTMRTQPELQSCPQLLLTIISPNSAGCQYICMWKTEANPRHCPQAPFPPRRQGLSVA